MDGEPDPKGLKEPRSNNRISVIVKLLFATCGGGFGCMQPKQLGLSVYRKKTFDSIESDYQPPDAGHSKELNMDSLIANELKLRYSPVAIVLSNDKPEGAIQYKEDTWGCVVAMFSAAARGKVAAFDRNTTACGGGKIGLGFCDQFVDPPGGIEYFLSTGRGEGYPEGEHYKKTPELAKAFMDNLPKRNIPFDYVIFKPLDDINTEKETPALVSMLATPDQISALVVLANYDRRTNDNVILEFGAGCHSIFLIPFNEIEKEEPRAVLGMTDITARPFVDADVLSFTVPWKMFIEMEGNVRGSFLDCKDWKKVRERIT